MKPVIFGCAGLLLTDQERAFFAEQQPAGFILFARNIENPHQLKALTTDLLMAVERSDTLILIDQEGGRVQRMTEPYWRRYPPMARFGVAAKHSKSLALKALELNCRMIADDLRRAGINTNCLPLLDVPVDSADPIIGDRAFAADPALIAEMGQMVVDTFLSSGILPVMKHLPGHGRAQVDSHLALPTVTEPQDVLKKIDFEPFKAVKNCPLGMTAHIVYAAIDGVRPATLSSAVIGEIIKEYIGFHGLLMTDDLSMKALNGSLDVLAQQSLDAGCDLVLHCNGDMTEMIRIAHAIAPAGDDLCRAIAEMVTRMKATGKTDRMTLEQVYAATMNQMNALL